MSWHSRRTSRTPPVATACEQTGTRGPARAALVAAAALAALASHAAPSRAASAVPSRAAVAAPRCAPARLNRSAAVAGARLTVSPEPDTLDASPFTQISILGAPAGALAAITVTGSRSGRHGGRLLAYAQGDGASFVPQSAFQEGEVVAVRGELRQRGAVTRFHWHFTVSAIDRASAPGAGTPPRPPTASDFQHFVSRPDLAPPALTVTARSPLAAAGDIFLAPDAGPGHYGPMIFDATGNLVWFKQLPPGTRAGDFRVQQYGGQPVLTWWQDPVVAGARGGAGVVIASRAYGIIAVVRAGNGYRPDLHEFEIRPDGTALLTIYAAVRCDLAPLGGPADGAVVDTVAQALDLRTGLVRYEWHSLDHVSLRDSYSTPRPLSATGSGSPRAPFDFFHINSIDVGRDGSLLIDARNTWAAYDVDARTGKVVWTLGGKHSSFALGPGAATAYQHDAREQPDGTITLFDNGAAPLVHSQSRGVILSLDFQRRTATLVRQYLYPARLVASSQGNFQALANGDWLIGWGQVPAVSEFAAGGALLFDAHFPAGYQNYRAYRFPWVASPPHAPIMAVRAQAPGAVVYASWNGATEVAQWRVLSGANPAALAPVATAARTGFETAISVAAPGRYLAVQALDAQGRALGSSAAALTGSH